MTILSKLNIQKLFHHRLSLMFVYMGIIFALFSFNMSANAQNDEVQTGTSLSCGSAFGSNTLDAECRCGPKQCRLSIVGDPDYSKSNIAGQSSSIFTRARYTCINSGVALSGTNIQSEFSGVASLKAHASDASSEKVSGAAACFTPITYAKANVNMLKDQDNNSPCFEFTFTAYEYNRLTNKFDATRVNNDLVGVGSRIEKAEDTSKNPHVEYTGVDKSAGRYKYCSSTAFRISYVSNPSGGCRMYGDSWDVNLVPSANKASYSVEVGSGVTVPIPSDVNTSVQGAEGTYYSKFYVDEFNKNPAAQNIPEGAVCTIGLQNKGDRAYWYDPNYFKLVSGKLDAGTSCTPILTSKDIFNKDVNGVDTFFGCLPASLNGLVSFVIRLLIGFAGLITFIIVLINLYKIIGNSTNPDVVADSRKKLTAAVITFIVILASITILNLIGLRLLDIDNFGGGLFRLFTGG